MRIDLKILSATFMAAYSINALASEPSDALALGDVKPQRTSLPKLDPYATCWKFAAESQTLTAEMTPLFQEFIKTPVIERILKSFKLTRKGTEDSLKFTEILGKLDKMPKLKEILDNKKLTRKVERYNIIYACICIHEGNLDAFVHNLHTRLQTMEATDAIEPIIIDLISKLPLSPDKIEELKAIFATTTIRHQEFYTFVTTNPNFIKLKGLFSTVTERKLQYLLTEIFSKIETKNLAPLASYLDENRELKNVLHSAKLSSEERYNIIYSCSIFDGKILDKFVRDLHTRFQTMEATEAIETIIIDLISELPESADESFDKIDKLKKMFAEIKNPKLLSFFTTNDHYQSIIGLLSKDPNFQEKLMEMFYDMCLEMGIKPVARIISYFENRPALRAILHDTARTPKEIYKIIWACAMDVYIHNPALLDSLDSFVDNLCGDIATMEATESIESIIDDLVKELADKAGSEGSASSDSEDTSDDEDGDLPSKPKKARISPESD